MSFPVLSSHCLRRYCLHIAQQLFKISLKQTMCREFACIAVAAFWDPVQRPPWTVLYLPASSLLISVWGLRHLDFASRFVYAAGFRLRWQGAIVLTCLATRVCCSLCCRVVERPNACHSSS